MGVTNGIDLSPDGKTLYVGESKTREIWAYRVDGANLVDSIRVIKFDVPPKLRGSTAYAPTSTATFLSPALATAPSPY